MYLNKIEMKYNKELARENRIQKIMQSKNYDRVQAVHTADYEDEKFRQKVWSKSKEILITIFLSLLF